MVVTALANKKAAKKYEEESDRIGMQISDYQCKISELEEAVEDSRDTIREIHGKWIAALNAIGIHDMTVQGSIAWCKYESAVNEYKNLCAKYE